MPDLKDNWDKADVIAKVAGAIFIPIILFFLGHQYKAVEEYRADKQKEADSKRADISADAQIRAAKAETLTHLIDSLAGQDLHKQELAFRAVQIVMPNEAPNILELVKGWQGNATLAATAQKVLEEGKKQAVLNLFNRQDGAVRGAAYQQLTTSAWRTDLSVAEAVLNTAEQNFDFKRGIDNAVVTLRDMSRTATQDASISQRILDFADKVEKAYPEYAEDTASLRRWIKSDRKS